MRFSGPLILCALTIAVAAPPALAAPVADTTILADTLNAPNTLYPGTAPAPAAIQPPRTRAEAKADLRRERAMARVRTQEERYQRRLRYNEGRDSARRMDNLFVGAGVSMHGIEFRSPNDTDDSETSPSVGVLLGYRNHFAGKLGMKTGLHYHTGATMVERSYNGGGNWIFNDRANGTKGTTSGFDALAQMILGPFGRFAFEPGLIYGMGWHSAKAISLDGDRNDTYTPKPRYTYVSGVLGASLFLGRHDQIYPSGWIAIGKMLGDDAVVFQMGAGFSMAFREE